jgi:hypothetical protein
MLVFRKMRTRARGGKREREKPLTSLTSLTGLAAAPTAAPET